MTELNSNVEWKKWGEDDPLFGVASWKNKQKDGPSPWTDEEFYEMGRSDWDDFLGHWQSYGVNTESCLEFGCGAGRITKQLSGTFQRVFAVDVSEGMIRRAQSAVGPNIEFSVIDGSHLPQPDSSIKGVFSTHVLQHLENVHVGYGCFREFYRVLDSTGSMMIHLPLYMFPGGPFLPIMRFTHEAGRRLGNISAFVKRRLGIKTMRGTSYSVTELYHYLLSIGFKKVEFNIFPTKCNGDLHPFVFGTK